MESLIGSELDLLVGWLNGRRTVATPSGIFFLIKGRRVPGLREGETIELSNATDSLAFLPSLTLLREILGERPSFFQRLKGASSRFEPSSEHSVVQVETEAPRENERVLMIIDHGHVTIPVDRYAWMSLVELHRDLVKNLRASTVHAYPQLGTFIIMGSNDRDRASVGFEASPGFYDLLEKERARFELARQRV